MVQTHNSERGSVYHLADDPAKNIVIFINDWYAEYGAAFKKLADKLGRSLHGILLIDKGLKDTSMYRPDPSGTFEEVVCDFSNDAELRATLKKFEDNILLVSCSAERSQMDFQRVLPHIPYLLNPSERSLEWATHKGKMREIIGAYDSRLVPKVQPVASASEKEIAKVLRKLTFPMILKPTGLSDSTLVIKVHNEEELRTNLHKAFNALRDAYSRKHGNGDPGIIVEEFMEGDLYSIDGYVNETGEIWLLPLLRSKSAYQMGLEGFYIYQTETYHDLTPEENAAGLKAAEDAMRAIGLRSSVAHTELYKTSDGWKIIEIAARPGALRQEVYEVSYGVDHALNELLLKIGIQPDLGDGHIVHSMVFKIYPESAGKVVAVDGVEAARAHPSAYTIMQHVHPGDTVLPITQGGSVAVKGLLFNNNVTQLRDDVSRIRTSIKITTETPARTARKTRKLVEVQQ